MEEQNLFADILGNAAAAAISEQSDYTKENADTVQRSKEWFAAKLGNFSASGMPKLMSSGRGVRFGLEAIKYVLKIAIERTLSQSGKEIYIEQQMQKDFVQTRWGNRYEPEARECFESVSNLVTESVTFKKLKKEYGLLNFGGSADFVAVKKERSNFFVGNPGEIKCPYDPMVHEQNLQLSLRELPKLHDYYSQCQAHIFNFGSEMCYFVSYDPRRVAPQNLAIIKCNRDDDFIGEMIERLQLSEIAIKRYLEEGVPVAETLNVRL